MLKKILLCLFVLLVILTLVEVVALLKLKSRLSSYAGYWNEPTATGEFIYVALGDSAAQGIGASTPQAGYVGLLAARIQKQTGKSVQIINLSVSGAKIEDVINKQLPELKNYQPDLITLDIGANDVATAYNASIFAGQYDELASQLPTGTVIGNMPYFGGRIRHNTQAINADTYIAVAGKKYGLPVADLQTFTKSRNSLRNYAADYFHPSNRGYQNWADAYWAVIRPTLK